MLFFNSFLVLIVVSTSIFLDDTVVSGITFDGIVEVGDEPASNSVNPDNNTISIKLLDTTHHGYWNSINKYTHGIFSTKIKTPANFTAGVITAFYAVSDNYEYRDEIDIEIIGASNPWLSIIHTNFYSNGNGTHAEQFSVWFDPSADFHEYSIIWSKSQIVWLVDGLPLRVHVQDATTGTDLVLQPLRVSGSIWDASDWATKENGQIIPINYLYAPFTAAFTSLTLSNSCQYWYQAPLGNCNNPSYGQEFSWDEPLTFKQRNRLKWYRRRYLHYSYLYPDVKFPVGGGKHPPGVGGHRNITYTRKMKL